MKYPSVDSINVKLSNSDLLINHWAQNVDFHQIAVRFHGRKIFIFVTVRCYRYPRPIIYNRNITYIFMNYVTISRRIPCLG